MASIFPGGIDTFTNPVYTKLNGEDVVSASHVNDLQDAVRNVQEVLAGAGLTLDMDSNNFIADNSSFKTMIEALDDAIGVVNTALSDHKNYVLVSDPVQHHANVIEVTSVGNLSSTRVQPALEEHQADINAIMTGGSVEGISLDNRYVNKSGAQTMQGPLNVTLDLQVDGNTTLGNGPGDTVVVSDELTVVGDTFLGANIQLANDLLVSVGAKIAELASPDESYIAFESDRLEFYSHGSFIFRLDADDATDGVSDASTFQIRDGADGQVFFVDELGNAAAAVSFSANTGVFTNNVDVGNAVLTQDKFDMVQDSLHIQLDKDDASASGRFFITMDGDTGANLASPDLLMNLDETSTLVTGVHKLKAGVQETGYFGQRVISDNAGGVFFGAGVNFKHELTNSPSSVTLTPDAGSFNYSNLSVVDMNQYGFFFEYDTPAVGAAKVFGTYTTVGN